MSILNPFAKPPIALGKVKPAASPPLLLPPKAPIALGRVQSMSDAAKVQQMPTAVRNSAKEAEARMMPEFLKARDAANRISPNAPVTPVGRPTQRPSVSANPFRAPVVDVPRQTMPAMGPEVYTTPAEEVYVDPGGSYAAPEAGGWNPPSDAELLAAWNSEQSAMQPEALVQSSAFTAAPATAALAKPIATTGPLSWWRRFLSWLGFGKKTDAVIAGEGQPNRLADVTAATVRRARNGDQNAMALMALVRDEAKQGSKKAQISLRLMEQYIRSHPVGSASFAGDPPVTAQHDSMAAAVVLSHGPLLSNEEIDSLIHRIGFTSESRASFCAGLRGEHTAARNASVVKANRMGLIVDEARKLQAMRSPTIKLSDVDSVIGWELGE